MRTDKPDIKKLLTDATAKIKNKKPVLIMLTGILGILLIIVSGLGSGEKQKDTGTAEYTAAQYESRISGELEKLVSAIDGVGRAEVMVTLDRLGESVYAEDMSEKTENQTNGKINSNIESNHIIIKRSGSGEEGLVRVVIEPRVRGVSVVCDGADVMTVKSSVVQCVSAVLGIGTNCISVTKMSQK